MKGVVVIRKGIKAEKRVWWISRCILVERVPDWGLIDSVWEGKKYRGRASEQASELTSELTSE